MKNLISSKNARVLAGALAAALMVGTAMPASAQTLSAATLTNGDSVIGNISLLGGVTYDLKLSWTGLSDSFALLGALVSNGVDSFHLTAGRSPALSGGSTSTTFTPSSNDTYLFGLYAGTFTFFPQYSVTGAFASVSPVVAVPGPIAGAGLPALLGLLGYGLYRRRKMSA